MPPYPSPQLSDALRSQSPFSYGAEVRSLQRALLLTPFVAAVGGGCFLGTALSLSRDRPRHGECRPMGQRPYGAALWG